MMQGYCGADCTACERYGKGCAGCLLTEGRPFGGDCVLYGFVKEGTLAQHSARILDAVHALPYAELAEVKTLNAVHGAYLNLAYPLPSGQAVPFWQDERIYLANQICKKDGAGCYGLCADEQYLMVAEYGPEGENPVLLHFSRWRA